MSPEIYYFSGTGNSLAVARDLAEKINGALIPVMAVIDQDRIQTDATVIGVVFPIYDFKPPRIIMQFIRKLDYAGTKYIFAVCTYGITPGKAMRHVEKELKACGGTLPEGLPCKCRITGLDQRPSPASGMNRCLPAGSSNAKSFLIIFLPKTRDIRNQQ